MRLNTVFKKANAHRPCEIRPASVCTVYLSTHLQLQIWALAMARTLMCEVYLV